jgi:hypothetical protein
VIYTAVMLMITVFWFTGSPVFITLTHIFVPCTGTYFRILGLARPVLKWNYGSRYRLRPYVCTDVHCTSGGRKHENYTFVDSELLKLLDATFYADTWS